MSMMMDAAQFYDVAKKAAQFKSIDKKSEPAVEPKQDFGDLLFDAAQQTLNTLKVGEKTAIDAVAGKADAHSVVEALATAEMAVQAAVTVRDRVVEAYQEILRMPV